MAEVTTTRPINLYQLGIEIGGPPSFRMRDDGTNRTIGTDDVTQAALVAAVAAHVADAAVAPPPPPPVLSAEEKLAAAKATLDALDALPTPVLTADVVDLLDDLRSVL